MNRVFAAEGSDSTPPILEPENVCRARPTRVAISHEGVVYKRKTPRIRDMGRRPELKSAEFSFVHTPFMRYRGVKTGSQQNKCYTFSELYPTVKEGHSRPFPLTSWRRFLLVVILDAESLKRFMRPLKNIHVNAYAASE